jgi:glycosyltransferase involved in cell wall biosynthesis
MRIGVAIPCYKYHIPQLKRCLDSIANQTILPDDVVVSCSSTEEGEIPVFNYPFSLRILTTPERKNAAENRNRAGVELTTDIVSFFDADDVMHPQRIEMIRKAFHEDLSCDIILHGYWMNEENTQSWEQHTQFVILHERLARAPSGCAIVKNELWRRIHHSQVSVSASIWSRYKFREDPSNERREDALFCGDVLAVPNSRNAYIAHPLSKYYMEGQTHTT